MTDDGVRHAGHSPGGQGSRTGGGDGTDAAAKPIERVLWNDPASGVMRHVDAGYGIALDCAREHGLELPGILGRDDQHTGGEQR